MTELIDWLRAQIDEDEQTAIVAIEGPWRVESLRDFHFAVVSSGTGFEGEDDLLAITNLQTDADHICRHDPARVLREVEAKRRIAQIHEGVHSCGFSDYDDDDPCDTLKLLALPYSDRPGYREQWSPQAEVPRG